MLFSTDYLVLLFENAATFDTDGTLLCWCSVHGTTSSQIKAKSSVERCLLADNPSSERSDLLDGSTSLHWDLVCHVLDLCIRHSSNHSCRVKSVLQIIAVVVVTCLDHSWGKSIDGDVGLCVLLADSLGQSNHSSLAG